MTSILTELISTKPTIYYTDFIDIAILALIFYSITIFLKNTRSYLIFLGLVITTGLYFIAKALNLFLTFLALEYFVGISVILFVILFQTELRRYFELLGLIGSRQMKVGRIAAKSPTTKEIVQACVQMAKAKIGALIVIQGKDSLETFLDGGVPLDGVISEEVLLSIFDPNSDGHDGAAIIRNNRISKFAAHLPLSTNFKELKKRGTRHGAALGLAERTDALCIVVSEEKKEISVCQNAKLKTLKDYSYLEKFLAKYINEKFSPKKENSFLQFFKHNFRYKIGAVLAASTLWFFTAYQAGIVEKVYKVPVKIVDVPESTLIENYSPKEINVTVSGRGEATFTDITKDDFKLTFSAKDIKDGVNKEVLTEKNLVIPTNLTLVKYEPNAFLLTSEKYYKVKIPVVAQLTGELPEELELKSVAVTPELVEVWVLQGEEAPTEILTKHLNISLQTESVILPIDLIVTDELLLENGDATVNIALTIEKKL